MGDEMCAGQEMTLQEYVEKLVETHRARKEHEQAKRMAKVCLDLHEALGVKWGEDPYAAINKLKEYAATLDETLGTAVEQAKSAEDLLVEARANAERLDREVHLAAGMVSTTGEWVKKHPQEVLDFIRAEAAKTAPEAELGKKSAWSKKVIVDFGDGKKIEVHPSKMVVPEGKCIRILLDADGRPAVGTEKYDELECVNGG